MHFYQFNINDFNASTRHLNHVERALYRDLIDMYYQNERAICDDFDNLCRKLIVKTDDEKQALQNVLNDFFVLKTLKGDKAPCWHNARIDRELKNYKHRHKSASESASHASDLQATASKNASNQTSRDKHNAKLRNMVEAIRAKGGKANTHMKIDELQALFDTYCKQNASDLQATANSASAVSSSYNHKPLTSNQEPLTSESENAAHPLSQNQTSPTAKQKAELSTPTAKKTKFDPKAYPIGDSVDPDLWADFCDMRKAIKKPLTEFACKQLVKDFNDWADEGLSPNRAIAESIKNSWQGVFRDRAIIKPVNPTLANQKPNRIEELGQLSQSVDWGNFYGNNQTFANPQPTLVGEQ